MNKPISARRHGLIDYGFAAIELAFPRILGVNKLARLTYTTVATPFLIVNGLTNSGVGLKGLLPMSTHKALDISFYVGLCALTFTDPIRKDRVALGFHLGLLALTGANILLSNYRDRIRYEQDEFLEYV